MDVDTPSKGMKIPTYVRGHKNSVSRESSVCHSFKWSGQAQVKGYQLIRKQPQAIKLNWNLNQIYQLLWIPMLFKATVKSSDLEKCDKNSWNTEFSKKNLYYQSYFVDGET